MKKSQLYVIRNSLMHISWTQLECLLLFSKYILSFWRFLETLLLTIYEVFDYSVNATSYRAIPFSATNKLDWMNEFWSLLGHELRSRFWITCKYWSWGQNRRWKLGQQSTIFWNYLSLFRDYGLDHIFLGIKLFCFLR